VKSGREAWSLAAAVAIAIVAYDPRAPAADPKRAIGLLVAVIALAASVADRNAYLERQRGVGSRSVDARRPASLPSLTLGVRVLLRGGGGNSPVLAFVGFVAWCGVTLLWGVPSGARDLGAWVAAAGIALACPVDRARRAAERAAVLAGSASAAIALLQRLAGARGIFVHGGQGNANWLGLLLAITLPLTLGLALHLRREGAARASLATMAAFALQLVGLALSHSRVAWAASALTLSALALPFARSMPSRWRVLVVVAPIAAIAIPLAIAVRTPARAAPSSIAEGDDVPLSIAWQGRVWIWRASADAAVAALPAGAGLGGFAHAYLDAQGERLAPLDPKSASHRFINATTAHADWLEVLVDSGLPALALLALALAWGAIGAARGGWPSGAAALAALAICAAGDSPLRQPGVALLLGLVLAGSMDHVRSTPRRTAWKPLGSILRAGLLVHAAVLLAVSSSVWIAARRLTAAKESPPIARRALLARAARLDPRSGEIALERGLLELAEGDADAAIEALRRSRALVANVGTDVAIGNAEVLLGRPEAALDAYDVALRRHPGSFRAHANITQPLLALGRLDEAERHLAIAAALWPGHPRLGEMAARIRRARIDRAAGP